MEQLSSMDMKAILHSKRANMFYLEYCRVMQKDGRVLYLTEEKKRKPLLQHSYCQYHCAITWHWHFHYASRYAYVIAISCIGWFLWRGGTPPYGYRG